MPIPNQRARVLGSGFTVFHWNDGTGEKVIAFAKEVAVQGVTPVADPVVIQPLDQTRPVEIATPGAHTNGVLTLRLTELYNQAVWQRLAGLAGSNDITDIMRTIAANSTGVAITKYVRPPVGLGTPYSETFYNCVIAKLPDSETISIETMTVEKDVEVWYTHNIKHWIK